MSTKRSHQTLFVAVAVSLASAATSAGQGVVSAGAEAAPARSFAELQPALKVGQQLIVEDQDGRTIRGRLVSLAGPRLEISRRRGLFGHEARVFSEASVRRIRHKDSTWNGSLAGLGAGILVSFLASSSCGGDYGAGCYVVALSPFVGLAVGEIIDGQRNRTVYLASRQGGMVVAPLLGPHKGGAMVRVSF